MKNFVLFFNLLMFFPAVLTSQVKINEVLYNTASSGDDRVELKNFGSTSVDVSRWWLCNLGSYARIDGLTIVSGSLNIPPGGILALSGRSLNNSLSDLGLYNQGVVSGVNSEFVQPNFMEDFVQWGAGGLTRENVAVAKGIWASGDFMATVDAGHSIEFDGEGNSSGDWFDQASPTIGAENGIVTSVAGDPTSIPNAFSLRQNYPNPFNPSTIIRYTIPELADFANTRLEVYNILGRKVKTLVNARQSAGAHSVQWDGKNDGGAVVANGVYVYRLKAGEFSDMKMMLFLK